MCSRPDPWKAQWLKQAPRLFRLGEAACGLTLATPPSTRPAGTHLHVPFLSHLGFCPRVTFSHLTPHLSLLRALTTTLGPPESPDAQLPRLCDVPHPCRGSGRRLIGGHCSADQSTKQRDPGWLQKRELSVPQAGTVRVPVLRMEGRGEHQGGNTLSSVGQEVSVIVGRQPQMPCKQTAMLVFL